MKKGILEIISSSALIVWGLWIGCPFFNTFSSSDVFHMMEKLMPELVWGIIILIIGITQMAFIFSKYKTVRIVMSLVNMFIFILLAIFYAMGSWKSTAAPGYLILATYSWAAFLEVLDNKKISKYLSG